MMGVWVLIHDSLNNSKLENLLLADVIELRFISLWQSSISIHHYMSDVWGLFHKSIINLKLQSQGSQ